MLTKVELLFVALFAQSGYISAYRIPTIPLFTATLQSNEKGNDGSYDGLHLRYHGPTATTQVLHDGHIADTHEVAAAKAEHFAAVSKAQTHNDKYGDEHHGYSHRDLRYHGPTAVPHVLLDGHIADTQEVTAAKAEHFAAVSKAHTHSDRYGDEHHEYSHGDLRYHGPTAVPHVLHNGHIADTQEVTAAKAEHFAAVSKAHTHSDRYSDEHHEYSHGDLRYHGPTAVPHVLHNGHIADTHEVAAAKAEHFAAVSKAQSHSGYHTGGAHGGYSGTHQEYTHPASYHGPRSLHSGYLADTPEVTVARQHHHLALSAISHRS